jgi:uncharacterized LabA/DUF88 family protein
MRTAFLVDGGFFLRRFHRLRGSQSTRSAARALQWMCLEHLRKLHRHRNQLYRIFYYDCPPLTKKAHHPLNGQPVNFAETPLALWRFSFFEELKRLRKFALRLGYLNERSGSWNLRSRVLKDLFSGKIPLSEVTESDLKYDVRQKGVDMRIGLDIASMTYKRLVDQMILVSGDSDFVPAAKLARREGIDFILDPMWASIRPDLLEHIDGLQTVFPKPALGQPLQDTTTGDDQSN